MTHVIHFQPDQWSDAAAGVNSEVQPVQQQERWEQLDDETWLRVIVRRAAEGFHRPAYVGEAHLMRGHRPDGKWRDVLPFEPTRIVLVSDPAASATPAPQPPARVETAGTAHIARTPYALPSRGK